MALTLLNHLSNLNQKINVGLSNKNLLQEVDYESDIEEDWNNPEDCYPQSDLSVLHGLDDNEIDIAMLALSQYIAPSILYKFVHTKAVYPAIQILGGKVESNIFLPTIKTALFLIEPKRTSKYPALIEKYFSKASPLIVNGVLKSLDSDPLLSDVRIECSYDFISRITFGRDYEYLYPSEFPGVKISSSYDWDDLIVPYSVESRLNILLTAFQLHSEILQQPQIGKHFRSSVVALFSGEPGTGKSMAASMIGQKLGLQVYRVDISQLVSKWVGETSKNLRILFDIAERKNWILFFDEADSIFSKRTKGDSANENGRNHDISYILMRMESFKGFLILATNLGVNIDDAFRRRIDMDITFMHPDKDTRIRLWKKAFSNAGLTFTERPAYKLKRGDLPAGDWDSQDVGMNFEEIAEYWEKATGAKINKVIKRLLEESKINNSTHIPSGVLVKVLNSELGLRKM